jgi:hypothetical protein
MNTGTESERPDARRSTSHLLGWAGLLLVVSGVLVFAMAATMPSTSGFEEGATSPMVVFFVGVALFGLGVTVLVGITNKTG